MCELFGISSLYPGRINICLHQMSRHGGLEAPHGDGWGIAYFEDRAVRLIKEPGPAWSSPWVRFIERQCVESALVLTHIRHATQGSAALGNTQPHVRELGGRMHVFAHNGDLGDGVDALRLGRYRPVGDTDSERAFCYLLHELEALWLRAETVPPIENRLECVRRFADVASRLGPANFLYSDGEALFVHGDCRRNPGEAEPTAPGLYALWRNFLTETQPFEAHGLQLVPRGRDDRAVLVASVPLTRENWLPLPRREVLVLVRGQLIGSAPAGGGRPASFGPLPAVSA